MKKTSKFERSARKMVRHILREPGLGCMRYEGSVRKGRFWIPLDRSVMGKKVIQGLGDDVTPEIVSRVISLLKQLPSDPRARWEIFQQWENQDLPNN